MKEKIDGQPAEAPYFNFTECLPGFSRGPFAHPLAHPLAHPAHPYP